jgi:hypothetical protein
MVAGTGVMAGAGMVVEADVLVEPASHCGDAPLVNPGPLLSRRACAPRVCPEPALRPLRSRASPVPNVYDVLDTDMGDDDPAVDDLEGSAFNPDVRMATPTMDGTVMPAMDTPNHARVHASGSDNFDNFAGSSNTAYLDSGNQLPEVPQSLVAVDKLEATTGHINWAVAGSHMTITHTGIRRIAPGIVLPAVVCPGARPTSLRLVRGPRVAHAECLDAAAARAHVRIVCATLINKIMLSIHEDRVMLPLHR